MGCGVFVCESVVINLGLENFYTFNMRDTACRSTLTTLPHVMCPLSSHFLKYFFFYYRKNIIKSKHVYVFIKQLCWYKMWLNSSS